MRSVHWYVCRTISRAGVAFPFLCASSLCSPGQLSSSPGVPPSLRFSMRTILSSTTSRRFLHVRRCIHPLLRQARSCGVNVLKALQESVCRSSFSSSSSRSPLGAEATHFFFRDIGADYEDFSGSNSSRSSLVTKSSSGQGMDLAQSEGLDGTLYRRSGWNERDVRIRINQSSREQNMFSGSPGKPFSRGRTRAEEPWSPPSDECQSHGGAGRRDERSRAQRDAPAASVLRHPPDPTSRSRGYRTQTLESKRLQVDFSHRIPEQEGRFKKGAVDAGKAGHDG